MKKKFKLFGIIAMVVVILFSMLVVACDNDNGGDNGGGYVIGDTGPGGGKIFYVSKDGFTVEGYGNPGDDGYFATYTARYLEAAPENAHDSTLQWGDYETTVVNITTNTTANNISAGNYDGNIPFIGQGRKDTMAIVAHMNSQTPTITETAAQYAAAYSDGGKNDWFLPSLSELSLYYFSSVTDQKPTSGGFWSSSQSDSNNAWVVYLGSGGRYGYSKLNKYNIRAIRAF